MSEHIISLGCRCDVAWQIRRRFEITKANPFDWLVTPLPAITKLLTDGFDRITDNLEAVKYHGENGWTIFNPEYRLYLHHEFARMPTGEMVPDWRNNIQNVATKYRAIGDRFFETLRETPAATFVRRLGDFTMPGEEQIDTPHSQVIELLEALESRMTATPRLLLLNCASIPDDQRVVADRVENPSIEEMPDRSLIWRGSTLSYDALFDRHLSSLRADA